MSRAPIRIRTFIIGTILVLLMVPTLAGATAWLIERNQQQAAVQQRVNTAVHYLASERANMQQPAALQRFAQLLARLGLLAQLTLATDTPPAKTPLYTSPALLPERIRQLEIRRATNPGSRSTVVAAPGALSTTWADDHKQFAINRSDEPVGTLTADLYYPPTSGATRALVALLTGIVVLLVGLAVAIWLTGRWLVVPLTQLSTQVDKVAGGELTIAVPRSRIGEIANIAQAVTGMTAALGDNAQQRTATEQARQFLVTGIAHDLRTPLFALRGHLQAIASRLGNPGVHLERAEARADALERLIGNLFAYTRDDYAQPALQLQAVSVAEVLEEVSAGVEHAAHLRDTTIELDGPQAATFTADRDRLKRALTNILDNAIRYSPPGATVRLTWATLENSDVQINVDDDGPGIDPELLPRIFEPGRRGNSAPDRDDTGAGLGLTIAKRLLEIQHTTLTIHNRSSGGTRVRLTFQPTTSQSLRDAPGANSSDNGQ